MVFDKRIRRRTRSEDVALEFPSEALFLLGGWQFLFVSFPSVVCIPVAMIVWTFPSLAQPLMI